jgi:hypothetical protein
MSANCLRQLLPLSGRDLGKACDAGEDDLVRVAVGQRDERGRALNGLCRELGQAVECLVLREASRLLKHQCHGEVIGRERCGLTGTPVRV